MSVRPAACTWIPEVAMCVCCVCECVAWSDGRRVLERTPAPNNIIIYLFIIIPYFVWTVNTYLFIGRNCYVRFVALLRSFAFSIKREKFYGECGQIRVKANQTIAISSVNEFAWWWWRCICARMCMRLQTTLREKLLRLVNNNSCSFVSSLLGAGRMNLRIGKDERRTLTFHVHSTR